MVLVAIKGMTKPKTAVELVWGEILDAQGGSFRVLWAHVVLCLVINLQGTVDVGETEDLGNALVEGDGLGDDVTEVSPFLGPCAELGHDVVGCEDIVGRVSCICVNVVNIAIVVFS